jgi:hypothetical protein
MRSFRYLDLSGSQANIRDIKGGSTTKAFSHPGCEGIQHTAKRPKCRRLKFAFQPIENRIDLSMMKDTGVAEVAYGGSSGLIQHVCTHQQVLFAKLRSRYPNESAKETHSVLLQAGPVSKWPLAGIAPISPVIAFILPKSLNDIWAVLALRFGHNLGERRCLEQHMSQPLTAMNQ